MDGRSVREALWPSLLLLQFFGTTPISLRGKFHGEKASWFIPGLLYIFTVIALIGFCLAHYFTLPFSLYIKGDNQVITMYSGFVLLMGPICSLIILGSSLLSTKDTLKVFENVSDQFLAFPRKSAILSPSSLRGLSLLAVLILIIVGSVQVYHEQIATKEVCHGILESWDYMSMHFLWVAFDLISWGTLTQFVIISTLLSLLFCILKTELADTLESLKVRSSASNFIHVASKETLGAGSLVATSLRRFRRAHMQLIFIAEEINSLFATRILIYIAFDTTLLCFSSYMLLISSDGKPPPLLRSLKYVIIRFAPICATIFPFSFIQSKLQEMHRTLHFWMTHIERPDILDELTLFANQLNHRRPTFSAHSFFNLDPSTITAVIGVATTYLVAIVQFHYFYKTNTLENYQGMFGFSVAPMLCGDVNETTHCWINGTTWAPSAISPNSTQYGLN